MMKQYISAIGSSLKYMKGEKKLYLPSLLGVGFGYTGMVLLGAMIPKVLIDASISRDFSGLKLELSWYAGLFALSFAAALISQNVYRRCVLRALALLRERIMKKKTKLPVSYFENNHSGNFLARMIYDMNKTEELYRTKFKEFFNSLIGLVTSLIPMIFLNAFLTGILFFFTLLCLLMNLFVLEKIKRAAVKTAEANGQVTERSSDLISGILTIKQYQLNSVLGKKFREANEDFSEKACESAKWEAVLNSMNTGSQVLCSIVFLVAGSLLVRNGQTTYGTLVALMNLEGSLIWGALSAGKKFPEFFDSFASVERIDEFLNLEEENTKKWTGEAYPVSVQENQENSIVFEQVCFGYEKEINVLENFNLRIKKNEVAVISGRSGCGKSTVFKLMMGFYLPDRGNILMEGKPLQEYETEELRNRIAFISQTPFLFDDTIENNIRCGRRNASKEEIEAAAKAAHAHEFIMSLPGGYQYMAGEKGNRLSFGQKQRISIARAFLKDAPVILFDEATSGLDYESEGLVMEAVADLIREKTAVIITHRDTKRWEALLRETVFHIFPA